jgi:hypothetical protein
MKVNWIWIYVIVVTVLLVGSVVYFNKKIQDLKQSKEEHNKIELTNYTYVNKVRYLDVGLTNITTIIVTNKNGEIDTNIMMILPISEYQKLLLVKTKYSNYVISLIDAAYTNSSLILSHYENTNIIKLPKELLDQLKDDKKQQFWVGLSTDPKFWFGYDNFIWNYVGIGASFGISPVNIKDGSFMIKLTYRFN